MIHWHFIATSRGTAFTGQSFAEDEDNTTDEKVVEATNEALRACKRMAQLTESPWDPDNVSITVAKHES